ncbi:hypothetical protein [Staphylococcus gallinarum]|uniref:hypothetical protein n=1 Tax=Staphylococcus gallinarum TaxID=1293 RepID=UPI0030BA51A1
MANISMYVIEIIGNETDVNTFVRYMKGEENKQLCGVYTEDVYYMYYNNKHIVNGSCRGSVYTSMLGEKASYYERLTKEDKNQFTTLEKLSRSLNLKLDVTGKTDVVGDKEMFIVDNGKIYFEK